MPSQDWATIVSVSTKVVDGPALIEVPHGQFAILVRADARLETDTGGHGGEADLEPQLPLGPHGGDYNIGNRARGRAIAPATGSP